jgi:molybdopterin-guanine dinucleotide biosynthesis protein A
VLGLLLAGGQARRMGGGDKCLALLAGQPLLQHVINRARPQVSELVLNANGDSGRFSGFGLEVVADVVEGYAGPLAGVLTGLEWAARHRPQITWVATFATDTPFFPADLVARFLAAVTSGEASLACAFSGGFGHPVFGLWPVALRQDLRHGLVEEGIHKVDRWTARHPLARVSYPDKPCDPFFNINTPEELALAEQYSARCSEG